MIEREAKLFEAGVILTGSRLQRGFDRIIANTTDAPPRIEHSATPFDGAWEC